MEVKDRRQFLKVAGGATLAVVALGGVAGLASCRAEPVPEPTTPAGQTATPVTQPPKVAAVALPWPYARLDPVAAAERAYVAYSNGGCMYGAFEGIIGELREKVGPPYDAFPAAMMKYGGAGVVGWGTLCGALNGAAAAVYMLHEAKTGKPILDELFGWYGAEELPDYKPLKPKFDSIATSVSGSPLCHQSVTNWSNKSGLKIGSAERAERCAWITAATVHYAVRLLNEQASSGGALAVSHKIPPEVAACLSCHGKGGMVENVHMSSASSCVTCHDDITPKHPAR